MRNELIGGFDFTVATLDELTAVIASRIVDANPPVVLVHGNCHTLYTASQDAQLRRALIGPNVLLILEGIGLKLAIGLARGRWSSDVSGNDLVPATLAALSSRRLRLALVGGAPGVARAAAILLVRNRPEIDVVSTMDGFEDLADSAVAAACLREARPDMILVGLGTPRQELAATSWLLDTGAKVVWTVGGLMDFFGAQRPYAPAWVRRLRFEWAFRLALEPRRLFGRTFIEGPWLARQLLRISREVAA